MDLVARDRAVLWHPYASAVEPSPLFGVVAAYFIMKDSLTIAFGVAALLVIAGLYLVNKPDPRLVPDPNVPV